MQLKINPEYKSLISPLSSEEFAGLEKSIKEEGCRDAIVTWQGVIVDGHNRYEICQKHGIDFTTIEKDFTNDSEAKEWIIYNQLSRRNITAYVRAELILKLKPVIAERARENQGMRTDLCPNWDKSEILPIGAENLNRRAYGFEIKKDFFKAATEQVLTYKNPYFSFAEKVKRRPMVQGEL